MMRRALATGAAVLLLSACAGEGGDAEPDPTPDASGSATGTADPGPVVQCPDAVQEADPDLPDAVPEGATSVRLCEGGDGKVSAPVDALTTDVAAVVDAVNEQPIVTRRCADLRLSTYQLAFGYPDGSTFVTVGSFAGCADLLVGSVRRRDARQPLRAFVHQLVAQRSTTTPPAPGDPASLACEQPFESWTWPLGRPVDLAVAAVCFGDTRHPAQARSAVIAESDLATLTASMEEDVWSSVGSLGCTYFSRKDHWIVGTNAWGDPITMTRGCGSLTVDPARHLEWSPRGDARRILRELVAQVR